MNVRKLLERRLTAVKIYRVGGAVRDKLLGLPIQDEDFVVVGASVDDMLALGFLPVGKDFPVFLHPQTHEEYALARTERKSGRGYKGFQVETGQHVTLEEDLARRDLTINAMAEDETGELIDPFHGQQDLKAGILRHVSEAFVEDPVRILRIARFAARFQFEVAKETMVLMQQMVVAGEVDALVPERVWQEISRGLMEKYPARMLKVLKETGALKIILPELEEVVTAERLQVLDRMAKVEESLACRFGVLTFDLTREALQNLNKRLRLPQSLLSLVCRLEAEKVDLLSGKTLSISALLTVLVRCDVMRRPMLFEDMLNVFSWLLPQWEKAGHAEFFRKAATAIREVDGGKVAKQCARPHDIPVALEKAREAALSQILPA